jgi:hypothetical protein
LPREQLGRRGLQRDQFVDVPPAAANVLRNVVADARLHHAARCFLAARSAARRCWRLNGRSGIGCT